MPRRQILEQNTVDKCNICGWTGPSTEVVFEVYDGNWHCPQCGSTDVDDINADPYEDDDGDWGELY